VQQSNDGNDNETASFSHVTNTLESISKGNVTKS